MSDSGLDIAIIGATGAVGSDLMEAFERSAIDVARFIPVARAPRVHPPVEVGGGPVYRPPRGGGFSAREGSR